MIPIIFKRLRSGKRTPIQLAAKPRDFLEYVTYEHSVERWYA